MFNFNIILTEKCNARCSHCYMSSDNGFSTKSLSKEQIDVIVEKMPEDTKIVVFTGGEVFLEKELLHYSIRRVKELRPNAEVGVESNGIYLYNNLIEAKNELKVLKELGVSFMRFSDDVFHEQGGVNLEKVRNLKQLEDEDTPTIKFLVQDTALAIGKAKNLPEEQKAVMNCMNSEKSLENPYLFLDIDGNVFICAWKCSPAIANIFNDNWQTLVSQLESNLNKLILAGKIEEAVNLVEPNNAELNLQYSKEKGQCMLCNKVFKGEE